MLYSNLYHTTGWVNARLKLVAGSQLFPDIHIWNYSSSNLLVSSNHLTFSAAFQLTTIVRLFVKILTLILGQ